MEKKTADSESKGTFRKLNALNERGGRERREKELVFNE